MNCSLTERVDPLRHWPDDPDRRHLSQASPFGKHLEGTVPYLLSNEVTVLRDQVEAWVNEGGAGDDVNA